MDLSGERRRIVGEAEEASKHLKRVDSLLSKAAFMNKAPDHVVERERERAAGLRQRLERLEEVLAQLPG